MDISKLAVLAHFAEQVYKLVKKIERDVQRTREEEEPSGSESDSGQEEDVQEVRNSGRRETHDREQ